jgi:hypothetical protein
MKKLSLLILLFLQWNLLRAAPPVDYEKIDAHARATPAKYGQNVDQLAKYLTKPAKNDYEKVRSFFVWMSENIAYDVDLFRRYRPGVSLNITAEDVLKKGKAVCQGYADLFNALCAEAGIESRLIPGYSKGFGNENRTDFSNADHAWNAVKIEGKWFLLDATWGAGGLNEKMQYKAQFNEKYFLANPQVFIKDHMPLQPMWQLLECPVSMQAFIRGGDVLQQELSSQRTCEDFNQKIIAFEDMSEGERSMKAAEDAYRFNPANHLVMARGYMDFAHQVMSGIKREMSSREEIEDAVSAQEEALAYLKKAQQVLSKIRDGAEMEKDFVGKNIKNSEDNLKAMKAVLK